jgi:aspartyl-tRNA(Asn)/glutamyl-tRNA(Gln) amidotransferase subunit B
MHDQHPTMSYVDLNRSGVALMEIVSRPDMRSPAEAGAYLPSCADPALCRLVRRQHGSEGSMRADVNVSVRKPGEPFGTRTETKNVNSVRFVMAWSSEARRQVDLIEDGGTVVQETRLYDPDKNETRSMRSARKMRTIIATSPIRTCCRWNWTTRSLRNAAQPARTARRQAPPL